MTATIPSVSGDQEWRDSALCAQVDPEVWFPEKGQNGTEAKKICSVCDVQAECLADALRRPSWADQYGVRGGMSAKQRAEARKEQT